MLTLVIIGIALALVIGHHAGHAHSNYRHGRAHGKRGVDLFWSSVRGPYVSLPGPFGWRFGHRL